MNASLKAISPVSNSQIDKIGRLLKEGRVDADCIRKLEEFRTSFVSAYTYVENILTGKLHYTITGRPSKSTVAITDKLRRESIRLSQIQDIAGCRILVSDLATQQSVVRAASVMIGSVEVDDKLSSPTNGYRAIHLIADYRGRCVEIQVRTRLQHVWAEISEKISDTYGQGIKYGRGELWAIDFLSSLSYETALLEQIEFDKQKLSATKARVGKQLTLIHENKLLNRRQRDSYRKVKSLFDSLANR